ncbi:outer membrane beta-barrel protein [Flagellimonas okinawensis]|uniref:Outer membrane beta-barrel protein n=1 Tax=Flagellimonas okinawensis TaxID=3031324 RepID=A0ABT5XPG3_9FLAO|nr:outer membrane beta-barrel protein [[Muricauda] okinawensis]MDF0707758.1 outer membrane beta-barrel protein [[Muricauda] okinawensis]
MKSYFICFFAFVFCPPIINAQEFHIRGRVIDSISKTPLEAATVHTETLSDSTLIQYAITDVDGRYSIKGRAVHRKIRIVFSFNGYKTIEKIIEPLSNTNMDLVYMVEQAEQLEGVSIIGRRAPITIKKDTLEFNAASFKTRPDATVEEVLKKLPGVEIDSDGRITVNGKEVDKVLVNGQVFFSSDPKVATKSLPKEIINTIQITDTKTKEQEFTGDAGDGNTKTINLTLKEDKNRGYMGRLSGGYGTDDRYQANGLMNYFNDTERISLIGSSNNVNNPGFSFDEIYEMVGSARSGGLSFNNNGGFSIGNLSFGFGQGITTSSTLGGSYANQEKNVYKMDGNYFYTYSGSQNEERTFRENLLPDNHFFTETESNFEGNTSTNQGTANLEFDIDKSLRITAKPSLNFNRARSTDYNLSSSYDDDDQVINQNISRETNEAYQRKFSNEIRILKKLDSLGRYVSLVFENQNDINDVTSKLYSQREIFGSNPSVELLDQQSLINSANDRYNINVRYRQPLSKNLIMEFGYGFENWLQTNTRTVFEKNPTLEDYSDFDSSLSSDFKFSTKQHLPSLGLRYNAKKISFNITAVFNRLNMDNRDDFQESTYDRDSDKLLFESFLNYSLGNNKRLSLSYRSNLSFPTIQQLQPIANVNNPLNIVTGNPRLLPQTNHHIYFSFNNYNWRDRTGFLLYSGFDMQDNQVVTSTETSEDLVRTTTYTNVSGNYGSYTGITYSREIKKDSTFTLKYNLRPYLYINKAIGFTNGSRLEANQINIRPRVGFTFNFKELIEIEPEYTYNIYRTSYNLENLSDVDFIRQDLSLKTTLYWPRNVIWGNDVAYIYNGNVGQGFDKDAIYWNMSIGFQFMKKLATLKFLAFDLLNQNINTRRTTGQDFIQDYQGTVLKQYFMGSLTIKFDSFAKNGAKKEQKRTIFRL